MEENPYKAPVERGITGVGDDRRRLAKVLALIAGLLVGATVGGVIVVVMLRAVWNAQRLAI